MKKLLFLLTLCLLSLVFCPLSLKSQTIPPPYINYQAVLYDVNGANPNNPLINQSFSTFVNINDELGNLLYREEHYASTDANGLITVKMGDGLYTAGPITNFNQINWGVGKYYLVVDFDINGTISSTAPEQLVTVPYSFYAGKAGNGMTAVADNGNGTLTFTYANGATYTTPTLSGITGNQGPIGPAGANGIQGPPGIQGPAGNGFTNGSSLNQIMYWNGTSWTTLNPGTDGQVLAICGGNLSWTTLAGVCPVAAAVISALNCASSSITGTLTSGIAASSVSASVPYTGGNSGSYTAQTISSTGVTGLTATLTAGILANGAGSLSFAISGTPTTSGTASFALTLGGQSCSFSIPVQVNLVALYPAGSVFCASGPTAIVDVTNPTTGKIWMDRNLGASQVATSSTDAASYGDLYQWGRGNDGHQCRTSATTATLSSTNTPANGNFILAPNTPFDWRSPQNANLWQGVNGVNNPCPTGYRIPTETEINAERLSWSVNTSVGAFASPLKLPMSGGRFYSSGSLNVVGTGAAYWSSTVSGADSRRLGFLSTDALMITDARAYGVSVRCIKDASAIPATIGAINCGSSSITGTLISGTAASGVSASVPYTGGNGGSYALQTISSTGVTGLTATLTAGILANGSGSLSFAISGTPATSGTASFALTIGGQSCTFTVSVGVNLVLAYPAGSVFCAAGPTAIVDVTNPTTGKIWMDRNLGASQVAASSTDANSYGDLYQWGRRSDGHQCRTSATTATLSSTNTPGNGNFILAPNLPYDWRSPQNANLWQGVNGVNNPCPSGYRIPTETEIYAERLSWSVYTSVGAFASPLKLPLTGYRIISNGSLNNVGFSGNYWSSAVSGADSRDLFFTSSSADMNTFARAWGLAVRCLKD